MVDITQIKATLLTCPDLDLAEIAAALSAASGGGGDGGAVDSVFGRTGVVVATSGDYAVAEVTGAAPLASPAFTGTPTAPTATALDNSTKIATTAYANAAIAALLSGAVYTGYVAPAVVALTDASTIAVNAHLGNDFRVTLGASRTIGAPSNPTDGQSITFEITQPGAGGPYTVTWNAIYSFGAGSAPTLSTAANATDLVAFRYNTAKTAWLCLGSSLGF